MRGDTQPEQEVQLGDGSDLEPDAFLEHELELAGIRVRLDRVVRFHARHRRREAPRLLADDGGIDQEKRLVVAVFDCRPDFLEIQARLGVRVEEVSCFEWLLSDGPDGLFGYTGTHLHRLGLPRTNLRYGNIECKKVLRAVALSFACHDDLLCGWFAAQNPISKSIGPGFDRPLCRQPNRSPYVPDYRDYVSEIKRNFRHFARLPRAPTARFAATKPQRMVGPVNLEHNKDGEGPITSDLGQGARPAQVFLETTMFGN